MAEVKRTFNKKTGKPHPKWKIRYKDRFGKMKMITGFTSKKQTRELADKIEENEKLIRLGLKEPPKNYQKQIDINRVLDDYWFF